jgi:hypothetical protein
VVKVRAGRCSAAARFAAWSSSARPSPRRALPGWHRSAPVNGQLNLGNKGLPLPASGRQSSGASSCREDGGHERTDARTWPVHSGIWARPGTCQEEYVTRRLVLAVAWRTRGFRATGAGQGGTIRLVGAHIGAQVDFTGATVTNEETVLTNDGATGTRPIGPALLADHLNVGQNFLAGPQLVQGLFGGWTRINFTATGAGDLGAVNLVGAHIDGQLNLIGAALTNATGPALSADNLNVGESFILRDKFNATGAGGLKAIRLSGAHVGGQLDLTDATLTNETGPASLARYARTSHCRTADANRKLMTPGMGLRPGLTTTSGTACLCTGHRNQRQVDPGLNDSGPRCCGHLRTRILDA